MLGYAHQLLQIIGGGVRAQAYVLEFNVDDRL